MPTATAVPASVITAAPARDTSTPAGSHTAAPDLARYDAVHQAMRTSNEWLVAGIARTRLGDRRRIAAIRRWFSGYAGEVRTHHRTEARILFPALAERVPGFEADDAGLAAHDLRLDSVIDGLESALRLWDEEPASRDVRDLALGLANDLFDLLAGHLDVGDADVLPLFERHLTADGYVPLGEQVLHDLDLRQAMFTVPWFLTAVDGSTAVSTWQGAPPAIKVLFRLTRRRYTKLATIAFG